jgi:hypothetical protein
MTTTNAKIAQQAYFEILDILYYNERVDFGRFSDLVEGIATIHYYIASCIDYKLGYSQLQYHTSYNRIELYHAYEQDGLRGVREYLKNVTYTTYTSNTVSHRWTGLSHMMTYIVYTFLEEKYIDNTFLTERLAKQHLEALRDADHISAMYNGFHIIDGKFYGFLKTDAYEIK